MDEVEIFEAPGIIENVETDQLRDPRPVITCWMRLQLVSPARRWRGISSSLDGSVFAKDAHACNAPGFLETSSLEGGDDGLRTDTSVHGLPKVHHHLLSLFAACEQAGEEGIHNAEVELEERGADPARRAGGLHDEDAAAGLEHPVKFTEGGLQIGEVAQRVAHGEEVIGVVFEGHAFGTALNEARVGQFSPRHGQHAITGFDAGDGAVSTEHLAGSSGNKPRATGNIEVLHSGPQAMAALRGPAVEIAGTEESPADDGIVMRGTLIEEFFDVALPFFRLGVAMGQDGMRDHEIFKHS